MKLAGCDTLVALGSATRDGSVILAKNSDRQPNEAQPLVKYPRAQHPAGSTLKCTYIEIPQVEETYAVIGSKPHWIWGFEHGLNEHGVAIGNEAVWSKEPPQKEPALLGMDLLRLGLERGRTAYEAMQVIIDLLETYGQGGTCVREGDFYYHNSFIIADFKEAWILETSGKHWVAKRVTDGVYSLSNVYSIGTDWDAASPDLVDFALAQGWATEDEVFDFSRAYSYLDMPSLAGCQSRKNRHSALLQEYAGEITVPVMMEILRDHYEGTIAEARFNPANAIQMAICMHARTHEDSETAASTVIQLRPELPAPLDKLYWSSFSSPCTSVFVPFYFDLELPKELAQGTHIYSPTSPWWLFEKLQRQVEKNYDLFAPIVRSLWAGIEKYELRKIRDLEKKAIALIDGGKEREAQKLLGEFSHHLSSITRAQAQKILDFICQLEKDLPSPANLNYPFTKERDEAARLE